MRKHLIAVCATFAVTAGAGLAQEFTATPRVPPGLGSARPSVEQNSNSSWFKKFVAAPNKLQLLNPAAPQRYGSGQQVVVANPRDPKERPYAIRLFSIEF
jgi:hypothetical protein